MGRDEIREIVGIQIKQMQKRLEDNGFKMEISTAAVDWLSQLGYDPQFGARPLKRAIQKYVEDTLAEEIITSKIGAGDEIFMDIEEGAQELTVHIQKAEKPAK